MVKELFKTFKALQKIRIQLFNRVVDYVRKNEQLLKKYGVKSSAPGRYAAVATKLVREGVDDEAVDKLISVHNMVYELEKKVYDEVGDMCIDHPFWEKYLSKIRGVGPVGAALIIGWLGPLSRFNTVSKLWKYCGLNPGARRRRGQKATYNPVLKSCLYVIAESLLRAKGYYKKLYDKFREECEYKHPDWKKIRVHRWAMRKMLKIFLSHCWEMWWVIMEEKESPTKPYAMEKFGHVDYMTPMVDKPDLRDAYDAAHE